MIKFDLAPLEDVFDEIALYIEQSKEDMKKYAGNELDIDYPSYRAAAEAGQMLIVTLRSDGKLVGFSLFSVSADLRDREKFEATNHGIYVDKSYREKYGMRIITEGDNFLRRIGVVQTMYINDSEAFGKLLMKLGYNVKYKIWSIEHGK